MKKIISLVIALCSCISLTIFASNPNKQDKLDLYVYVPNKTNFHKDLASMPAIKIPFKGSEIDSDDESISSNSDSDSSEYYYTRKSDRKSEKIITSKKFNNALYDGDTESLKTMITVEKHYHNFKKDRNPDALHTPFRSSIVLTRADLNHPNNPIESPLERAIRWNQPEIAKFLIDEGASITIEEGKLYALARHISHQDHFYNRNHDHGRRATDDRRKRFDMINLLLQIKTDCSNIYQGETPLHLLVRSIPTQQEFRNLCIQGDSEDNIQLQYQTALSKQKILMSNLLSAGANPYLRDNNGKTTFEVAKKLTQRETSSNVIEVFLHETVSAQSNIPKLHRAAREQLVSEEYRPKLLSSFHLEIQRKYAQALEKEGKTDEFQAYAAAFDERELTTPKILRLAQAQELSRQSHAIVERVEK